MGKKEKNISGAAFTTPLLFLCVMVLLWISEFYVKRASANGENVFLSLCIVQIVSFFIPTIFYYQLKHRKLSTSLLVSPLRVSHGVFVVFASLLFFSGQLLLKFFLSKHLGIFAPSTSYISFENAPVIQPILAFCVVPAVCEEFFFRGIVLSEYRSYGLSRAIFISAVFFAFAHFSFEGLITNFFAGLMLAFLTVVCRSVFPAMILHFANNLLDLYAGDFFEGLTKTETGTYFIIFSLALIFLVSLWRVFSRLQHIYLSYAENPPKESLINGNTKSTGAFRSWTLLLTLIAFLLITAISG